MLLLMSTSETTPVSSRRNKPPTFPFEMPRLYVGVPLTPVARIREATLAPVSKLTLVTVYFSLQRLTVLLSNSSQTLLPPSDTMLLVIPLLFSYEPVSYTAQPLAEGSAWPR